MVQKLDNAKHFDVLMLMYNLIEYDKKYTKKTNPKITILEILVYKIQPEIMQSKIFTRFNFITKPCVGNGHNKNLWQYHKDYLNDKITDSELFKFESKITVRNLAAANTRDVETDMLLECLSHL